MIQINCNLDVSGFLHCLEKEPWVKNCWCSGWVSWIQATPLDKKLPRGFQKVWRDVSLSRRSWIRFLCITSLHWSVTVQKHALTKACNLQYFCLLFYFVLNLLFLFINHSYVQENKWKFPSFPLEFKWISFAFRTSLNFMLLFSCFLICWHGLHRNLCSLLILQEYGWRRNFFYFSNRNWWGKKMY